MVTLLFVILCANDALPTPDIDTEDGKTWWYTWTVVSVISAIFCIFLLVFGAIPCNGPRSRKRNCHKLYPFNYILLAVFTLCITFLICLSVEKSDGFVVVQSVAMTTGMVIGLTTYAWTNLAKN